jgi:hypothetical protein
MTSHEECMREAAECDRLAGLAATRFTRNMMKVAAFHWRKLAEKGSGASGVGNDTQWRVDTVAILAAAG